MGSVFFLLQVWPFITQVNSYHLPGSTPVCYQQDSRSRLRDALWWADFSFCTLPPVTVLRVPCHLSGGGGCSCTLPPVTIRGEGAPVPCHLSAPVPCHLSLSVGRGCSLLYPPPTKWYNFIFFFFPRDLHPPPPQKKQVGVRLSNHVLSTGVCHICYIKSHSKYVIFVISNNILSMPYLLNQPT